MCVYRYVCVHGYKGALCTNVCTRMHMCMHVYIHAFTDTPDASTLHTSVVRCASPQEMLTHMTSFLII